MNYDNDDNREYSENLDRYVEEEMLKHYGRNVMYNSVQPQQPPSSYKRIHSKGFFFVMSIICAVLFLTGVGVLSGVIFSSGVPVNGTISSLSENSNVSSIIESSEVSSKESVSSNPEVSSNESVSSKPEVSSNESVSSSSEVSSNESVSSKPEVSSKENVSSNPEVSSMESIESSDDNMRSRPEYYSLPEITEESADIPHREYTSSPNNTVTTGRRLRAGTGVVLIIMSFVSAVWLYKLRESEEEKL